MALDPPRSRRTCARRVAALAVATAMAVAGCTDGQDPGIAPGRSDEPAPTSDTLGRCPPGGADATTPPAGCIGDDGTVRHG